MIHILPSLLRRQFALYHGEKKMPRSAALVFSPHIFYHICMVFAYIKKKVTLEKHIIPSLGEFPTENYSIYYQEYPRKHPKCYSRVTDTPEIRFVAKKSNPVKSQNVITGALQCLKPNNSPALVTLKGTKISFSG